MMTAVTRLDDLCEAVVDCPHSTPVWTDNGALVLRSQNIRGGRLDLSTKSFTDEDHYRDRSRRAEVRAGDIVITREAPMGEVCMIPPGLRCCLGQRMVLLRPNALKCDGRYLLYALQSQSLREQISWSEGTGSTVSNLRIPNLKALRVPTPCMKQQEGIGSTLGALDDKIEQNRRTARSLERLAREIFRAWFVDFEPVKAKAAGATAFPSMPQPVFDALPTRFVDSDIGPVPEGWMPKAVSSVFEVNPARLLRKDEPAPHLDMKNMPTEGHAPESWMVRPVGSGMRFMNGDTLVARITPCLENGKTAFVDFLSDGQIAWGSTEYIVLRPKAPLPPVFAYCLARTDEFRDFAIQNMTGTSGRQRVTPTAMDHFQIAVPSAAAAFGFGEIVQPLFRCIRAVMDESRKLADMRDYLLPKLLSGDVQVRSVLTEKGLSGD